MAKQVIKKIKEGPLTPEEQARINKRYEKNSGEKLKPNTIAEISKEDFKSMREGKGDFAVYYMGKTIDKPKMEKPKAEQPKEAVKVKVKVEEPKPVKPVEKKVAVKAVVETKPAEKVKVQDTRGFSKKGKQTVASKVAQKVINQQTFRRGAELAANNLLTKAGSSLKFKKALKNQVIK